MNKPHLSNSLFNRIVPAAAILAVLLVSLLLDPTEVSYPSCLFKSITGYNCPTCGLTRSFYAMSHLNISEAFVFHLMGPPVYTVLLLFFLKFTYESFSGKDVWININPKIKKYSVICFFMVWFSYWILKLL